MDSIGKNKHGAKPAPFWYISLVSGIILLTYAIHRVAPVFILGQADPACEEQKLPQETEKDPGISERQFQFCR